MNHATATKVVRHSNSVAVGTGTVTPSAGIDTAGFHGCEFIVLLGAITDGTPSVKVQQSDDDGVADAYSDLLGTSVPADAITDDNKVLRVDVGRPQKRYLKAIVTRGGTTGSILDGILAVLYDAHKQPIVNDATVEAAEFHGAPAEGTA